MKVEDYYVKRYLPASAALVASLLLVPILSTHALPAQAAQGAQAARPESQQLALVSLEKSMDPLVRYFNQRNAKPRLLVLLSPT